MVVTTVCGEVEGVGREGRGGVAEEAMAVISIASCYSLTHYSLTLEAGWLMKNDRSTKWSIE